MREELWEGRNDAVYIYMRLRLSGDLLGLIAVALRIAQNPQRSAQCAECGFVVSEEHDASCWCLGIVGERGWGSGVC